MDQTRDSFAAALGAPPVTAHARARMQQRGIRSDALEALLISAPPGTFTARAGSSCFSTRRRARAWRTPIPQLPAKPTGCAGPTRSSDPTAPSSPSDTASAV